MEVKEDPEIIDIIERKRRHWYGHVKKDARGETTKINPYPMAFPYGNGMVLHFYQQQESSTTKTVHKVITRDLKRKYSRLTLVRISIKL